jgi:hypothetical protein
VRPLALQCARSRNYRRPGARARKSYARINGPIRLSPWQRQLRYENSLEVPEIAALGDAPEIAPRWRRFPSRTHQQGLDGHFIIPEGGCGRRRERTTAVKIVMVESEVGVTVALR